MDFKTDALLALIIVIGGYVGSLFNSSYLDWGQFAQGLIGIAIIVGLVFMRFRMKDTAQKTINSPTP